MNKNAIKALQAGHDLLEKSVWIRGSFKSETKKGLGFCAIGAIKEASKSGDDARLDAVQALSYAVGGIGTNSSVYHFNDKVAHDKRDVLRKFRKAIRNLMKEGK